MAVMSVSLLVLVFACQKKEEQADAGQEVRAAERVNPQPRSEHTQILPDTSQGLMKMLEVSHRALTDHEIDAALDYLLHPKPAHSAADPEAEYFNHIIAILLNQEKKVPRFAPSLMQVVNNAQMSLILRDYALQHYFHAWEAESDSALRIKIEKQLDSISRDLTHPLQAVAILTSARLLNQESAIRGPNGEKLRLLGGAAITVKQRPLTILKKEPFMQSVLTAVTHQKASPESKIAALNVSIMFQDNRVLGKARQIVTRQTETSMVLSSAIAAIGHFGNIEQDKQLLLSIPEVSTSAHAAAQIALNKISDKN